jgi:hypothetical protein
MEVISMASVLSASHLLVVEPNQMIGLDVALVDLPTTSQHRRMFSSASAIRRGRRRTPGWRCEGRHLYHWTCGESYSLCPSRTQNSAVIYLIESISFLLAGILVIPHHRLVVGVGFKRQAGEWGSTPHTRTKLSFVCLKTFVPNKVIVCERRITLRGRYMVSLAATAPRRLQLCTVLRNWAASGLVKTG